MEDNYKTLAAAIIQRALLDYKEVLKNPFCGISQKELEDFFYSGYFKMLSDGTAAEYILRKMKEAYA